MAQWKFTDPVTAAVYTFGIGPNEFDGPTRRKRIGYEYPTALDGNVIIFEGRDEARTIRFSGSILTSVQYEAMKTWFNKRYQLYITDDNGIQYTIYITSFDPKRVRGTRLYPFRYTYTAEAVVTAGTT